MQLPTCTHGCLHLNAWVLSRDAEQRTHAGGRRRAVHCRARPTHPHPKPHASAYLAVVHKPAALLIVVLRNLLHRVLLLGPAGGGRRRRRRRERLQALQLASQAARRFRRRTRQASSCGRCRCHDAQRAAPNPAPKPTAAPHGLARDARAGQTQTPCMRAMGHAKARPEKAAQAKRGTQQCRTERPGSLRGRAKGWMRRPPSCTCSACAARLSSSRHPVLPRSPTSTGAGCWKRSPRAPWASR